MSESFSRRQLVTGAAALVLGENLAAAESAAPKKTYPVEKADPKTVTIKIAYDAGTRTIVATPDNGSARLNMGDTLVITSEQPFVLQFIPLNGGPAHPFVKAQEAGCPGRFQGTHFEAMVNYFDMLLPLPFYKYTIQVGSRVLDPNFVIDNPYICPGGKCAP